MKILIEKTVEGRFIRFTNTIDDRSWKFEESAKCFLGGVPTEQTLAYLQHSTRSFFLMQMNAEDGSPAMQTCIYLGRSQWFPGFALASVPKMARAKNSVEEEFGLRMLRDLCKELPGVMTLRLQPLRFNSLELMNFQAASIRQKFHVSNPMGPVRTLVLNIAGSKEDIFSRMPSKTRTKLSSPLRESVEIRSLLDTRFIDIFKKANEASLKRSGAEHPQATFDFQAAFDLAKRDPTRARIFGFFLKERPEELLAYVIGYRNGNHAEYVSAGSFGDPVLRSMPFNYFLMWQLIEWATENKCTQLEMGGVTDGGPSDSLRGIARFKRSLCSIEMEVGREMVFVLRPIRLIIYQALKYFQLFVSMGFKRFKSATSLAQPQTEKVVASV